MRLPIKYLVISILLLLIVGTASAEERITNGGFESGDITGWTPINPEDCLAGTSSPHSGTYRATVSAGASYYGTTESILQSVNFTETTDFSFWYKTYNEGVSGYAVNVTIGSDDVWNRTDITNIGTWTQVTITGYTGVQNLKFQVKATGGGDATLILDDISATTPTTHDPEITTYIRSDPTISTRTLPFGAIPADSAGTTLLVTSAKGEYEPASFIIRVNASDTYPNIAGINITPSELSDGLGHTIPTSAIDIKTIKAWYQYHNAANENAVQTPEGSVKVLIPELLLKNDSLVSVNYTEQSNKLWVTHANATSEYVNISNPTDVLESTDTWHDETTLQPFSMIDDENKQIWITVHVPDGQVAGNYSGALTITNATGVTLKDMLLNVTVQPFSLEQSAIDPGIMYLGQLYPTPVGVMSELKYDDIYLSDLQNMKNHGILYTTIYQYDTNLTLLNRSFYYQNLSFPGRMIWLGSLMPDTTWNATTNATYLSHITNASNAAANVSSDQLYVWGLDEPTDTQATNMIAPIQLAHSIGLKVATAQWREIGYDTGADATNMSSILSDYLDLYDYGPQHINDTEIALWHSKGAEVYYYNNPQIGIENITLMRYKYGYYAYNASLDGIMDYVYQGGFPTWTYGAMWNDFDDSWRDHMATYPTTTGQIDTLQWEGYREAIDDNRYTATLSQITGNTTEADGIITAGLAAGDSASTIRSHLIDHILAYGGEVIPTAAFTKSKMFIVFPSTITFTDTSTNTPDSWSWDMGDGRAAVTTQNHTYQYLKRGLFKVSLTATNGAGTDSDSQYVFVWGFSGGQQMGTPYRDASLMVSIDDGTFTSSRTLTDIEKMKVLCQMYNYGQECYRS